MKKTKADIPRPERKAERKTDGKTEGKTNGKTVRKADGNTNGHTERRLSARFPLGLPVRVHLAGQADPMTVELIDLSAGGGRFRTASGTVRVNQTASFDFLLPGPRRCLAKGRVVRTDGAGEFVLRFQGANKNFLGFIGQLAS